MLRTLKDRAVGIVVLVLAGIVVAVLIAYSLVRPGAAPSTFAPMSDAMAALDRDRPWTMTVVGDSTGNAPDEWVYQLVARLGQRYDRPSFVHDWSLETNNYVARTQVTEGNGAPIEVWNGSAAGMAPAYSLEHMQAMEPKRPDLVILNHGHNLPDERTATLQMSDLITDQFTRWKQRPPALALTLQNDRLDAYADRNERVVGTIRRQWSAEPSITVIDVFDAFDAAPTLRPLIAPDGVHPTPAGTAIWTDVAAKALGLPD